MSKLASSVFHNIPRDLRTALLSHKKLPDIWNRLTPIARNEWICWVTIVKRDETRTDHLERLKVDLLNGKRRPCCWPGCPHRNPKAKKYFTKKS